MRNRIVSTLIVLSLLLFGAFAPAWAETADLLIMHTNDMHGNLKPQVNKKIADPPMTVGGMAYLTTVAKKARAENPGSMLLLDGGDIAQGTPISNYFHGIPMVRAMNAVGYDATVLGNHEFDWGQKALSDMVVAARFPFLSANVVMEKNGASLPGVRPYILKDVSGMKVAIIGVTAEETPSISFKANVAGLKFLSASETVKKYIAEITQRCPQVKFFVVLSHLGISEDEKLAQQVPEIDVIVGGHSHTKQADSKKIGDTVIVQAGSYVLYYGMLHLKVDTDTGKITAYTEKNELTTLIDKDIAPDPEVSRLIDMYNRQVEPIMSRVVGKALEDLRCSERLPGHLDSPLGSLLCDAMRDTSGADLALYNGGGIRADINKGDITVGDVFKVLPFDNSLLTIDMKGEAVMKVLEQAAAHKYYILQVSGATFDVDMKGPEGKRVANILVDGKSIDPQKTYKVATIDFLYYGGDKLTAFQESTGMAVLQPSRDVFIQYIEKRTPLEPRKDLRIRDLTAK
jgi:2',3'-cyclic-nucleotide 2'-phosphodiesterase (5'-nucleotidase family)